MTPADLIAWRTRMGWTAKEAAAQLGLSQNGYAAYERGWIASRVTMANFEPVDRIENIPRPIPKHVELACERLEQLLAHSAR